MIKPGDAAPAVKVLGDDGKEHSLSEFAGKKVVLYFYPKDNTPGCTVEACEFRDQLAAFKKKGAVVVGVSPDSVASHQKFKQKHELNFLLLEDPEHELAEAFGAWGDKVLYGRKFKGLIRSTFIIDKAGKLVEAHRKVKAKGHAAKILESL
jgi:peroxiredoxin Q/BCP